jgi:O-antigen/teichoic acid export membrane protein
LLKRSDKLKQAFDFQDKDLTELLRGAAGALSSKLGSIVSVYLFTFAIARIYGSDGNGLFSFCYTFLNIAIIVSLFGLETYLIRYIAEFAQKKLWGSLMYIYRKALLLTSLITAGFVLIFYFGFPFIMDLADKESYTTGLQITAIALLPATLLRLNSEALKGLKQIKYYSLVQNGSIFLMALIGLGVFQLTDPEIESILWSFLIGQAVVMLGSFWLWNKATPEIPEKPTNPLATSEIVRSSIPFLLASTTFYLMNWTDKIMLGFMASRAELGVYEITFKIAQVIGLTLYAVNTIAAPKFSEFYSEGNVEQLRRFIQQVTALVILASIPLMLGIFLFPGFLLSLFGEAFLQGKTCLYILALAAFVTVATGSVIIILNMTGKQVTSQFILLFVGLVNITLNYFFIPIWGINGTALATLIANTLWNGLGMVFIYYYYGFWTVKLKTLINPLNPT